MALGVAGFGVDALRLLSASGPDTAVDELISIAMMMDLVALVQLASLIVGGVVFLAWFHRAYGNIRALGVSEPRYRRGWAIGAWFIPVANLVIPKQLANDLWRAGDPSCGRGTRVGRAGRSLHSSTGGGCSTSSAAASAASPAT